MLMILFHLWKKEWMKMIYGKAPIHEFLVTVLQYDFSQNQFQIIIKSHKLVTVLTFLLVYNSSKIFNYVIQVIEKE